MKHLLLLSLSLLLLTVGCGRKGPPKPPENFAPKPVQFFTIVGTVDGILLKWAKPKKKADGKVLDDLKAFSVMRAVYQKKEAPDFDELTEIEYVALEPEAESEEKPAKSKKKEEKVEEFSYLDREVSPGSRYVYYIVAFNEDNVGGGPSPVMRVTFIGEASQVELYTGIEEES